MKQYLAKMKTAMYVAPKPKEEPPLVLATLHPKMLQLSASEARDTHTSFVPPEHTAKARALIGPEAWICAAQAVILEADAAKARSAARECMKTYVPRLPNYTNNLKALGRKDEDFAGGCSDRLVEAIVAWGAEGRSASGSPRIIKPAPITSAPAAPIGRKPDSRGSRHGGAGVALSGDRGGGFMRRTLLFEGMLLLTAVVAGCQSSGDTKSASAGDSTRGAQHFAIACVTCHGPDGRGVKGLGKDLVSSEFLQKSSDDEVVTLIINGRDANNPRNSTGVTMPPKGGNAALSDKDIRDVVAYLRTIAK